MKSNLNKINVANIIEEGKIGGPQIRIINIARTIKNKVKTVVIIPKNNSNNFELLLRKNKVFFKKFYLTNINKNWRVILKYVMFSFYEIFNISIFLKKNKFDLVHVNGSTQYKGIIAAKISRSKVILHLNNTYTAWFLKITCYFLSLYCKGFIFASYASKKYYKKFIKNKKSYVIPSGVDTSRFNPRKKYIQDRKIISSWKNKFVIGVVSNINPVKGLETFLQVAKEVNNNTQVCQFVIVGNIHKDQFKYYNKLKSLIQLFGINNLDFVNYKKDVRAILNRIDLYLCTSKNESSPVSVWEAMSMAKPIVSTNVGDVSIYIKDNVNGFVVKKNIIYKMSNKILYLIKNKDKRKSFGKKSRIIAKNKLDLSVVSRKYILAYNYFAR